MALEQCLMIYFLLCLRTSEIEQEKGQVLSLQTQISQLNTEREELLGKIEAGDGAANTAIQQLKLQNVSIF